MTRELMIRLGDEGDSKNENLIKIDTPVNPNSQNSPEGLAPPNLSIHKNDLARSTFVPKLKSVVEDNNSKAWPIGKEGQPVRAYVAYFFSLRTILY